MRHLPYLPAFIIDKLREMHQEKLQREEEQRPVLRAPPPQTVPYSDWDHEEENESY